MVFVGKLIASKGVELLLAAWPLVLARVPRARLLVVGFGAFRAGLEGLARALAARRPRRRPRHCAPRTARELPQLAAFLDARATPTPTARPRAGLTDRVAWAGRLDHAELADLLPAAEAMVVPSTFPEAFGMVAAEAAACGALPVVARPLRAWPRSPARWPRRCPRRRAPWLAFERRPGRGRELADDARRLARGARTTCAPPRARRSSAVTRERYSWDGVARTVIAAARGELDGFPRPSGPTSRRAERLGFRAHEERWGAHAARARSQRSPPRRA